MHDLRTCFSDLSQKLLKFGLNLPTRNLAGSSQGEADRLHSKCNYKLLPSRGVGLLVAEHCDQQLLRHISRK